MNGILILQGPAGSGQTTIIKIFVDIAHKRGLKVAVVTEADSAVDDILATVRS